MQSKGDAKRSTSFRTRHLCKRWTVPNLKATFDEQDSVANGIMFLCMFGSNTCSKELRRRVVYNKKATHFKNKTKQQNSMPYTVGE